MRVSCPRCQTENPDDSKFCRECATPLPARSAPADERSSAPTVLGDVPVRELPTGTTLSGRYEIIEELGRGGMGRVYKAFDTKVGEKVAVKLLLPDIARDRAALDRFANEIRLARRITHRNVCRLHDLGEEQGTPYITMEYVSGEDLKSMLRMTGGLSPSQTVAIGRQVASGLAEAHRLGVVHRDLKPQNVMIDHEGTARIMDFGIAHSARTKGLTGRGALGTPEYMSPEQAEGEEVDARSDIYSLGAMLFEMATGRLPFEGRTPLAVAMKHKAEPPPDPSSINPRVPADLARVILKCLQKDPTARYQSAEALGEDFDHLGNELPAATRALPRRPATTDSVFTARPWRKWLMPAAAVLVPIAVAAGAWWLLSGRSVTPAAPAAARARNSVAVVGFDNQTGDPRFDHLRTVIPNLIITSLENSGRLKVTTWERMKDVLAQAGRKDVDVVDREGGFEVCRRDAVAFIVVGSFTKLGDMFATDVKVLDAESRSLVGSVTSRGEGEDSILRTQIDEIGRGIAQGLLPAESGHGPVPQIVDVTTDSMEAYSAYLRGRDAFERLYYPDAEKEMKRAVEIDPQFASAHYYLALAYYSLARPHAGDDELRLAKRHAARATEHERLAIEAVYTWNIEGDWEKRVRLLEDLTARYQQDKWARVSLAIAFADGRLYDQAIEAFQRALDLDPSYGLALNSLAMLYGEVGNFDLALQCLQKYGALNPNDANPLDSLADIQYRRGRLDEAAASYRRALAIRPDFGCDMQLAMIAALREDYQEALRHLDALAAHAAVETTKAQAHGLRAVILHLIGRRDAARAEIRACRQMLAAEGTSYQADALQGWLEYDDQAWAESRKAFGRFRDDRHQMTESDTLSQIYYTMARGLIDQAEGKVGAAGNNLRQAESLVTAGPARLMTLTAWMPESRFGPDELMVRRLQATALAAEGKLDQAIGVLTPVWPGPITVFFFREMILYYCPLAQDDLARLYVRKGDWDRAIAEYKVLTVIGPAHTNRRLVHPIYHYRLAQVYEKKGMAAEAIAEYERLATIWDKADPPRPEVAEARQRIAHLKSQVSAAVVGRVGS